MPTTIDTLTATRADFKEGWGYVESLSELQPETVGAPQRVMIDAARQELLNDLQLATGLRQTDADQLGRLNEIVVKQEPLLREALAALQIIMATGAHGAIGAEDSADAKRYSRFRARYEFLRSGFSGLNTDRGRVTIRRVKLTR